MLTEFISALMQLVLFACIPFVVYLIRTKSVKGFSRYIGLTKSTKKANLLALGVVVILITPMLLLMYFDPAFKAVLLDPTSVTGKIRAMGFSVETIGVILIAAVFKTSLTEEIFFRGFVAKRLIAISNFQLGNTIQAVIFGAIHTLFFMKITDHFLFLFIIFLFPAIGAYCKGYLNEKLANGSIIPGWIAHATGNLCAYSIVAFVV